MIDMNIELARHNMIEQQIRPWDVLDQRVLDLILRTPREDYVPQAYRQQAEVNRQASTDDLITETPDGEKLHDLVANHTQSAFEFYERLIAEGVAREQARMVLPQNMYTEMYATVNLHNLIHFIELRIHAGAQWEIQQYAHKLLDLAETAAPYAVAAIRKARNW